MAYCRVGVLVLHSVQKLRGAKGFWAPMCPCTSVTLRPWRSPLADHSYFTPLPVCKAGQYFRPKKLPRMSGCGSVCLCSPEEKGVLHNTVDSLKKGLWSRHQGTGGPLRSHHHVPAQQGLLWTQGQAPYQNDNRVGLCDFGTQTWAHTRPQPEREPFKVPPGFNIPWIARCQQH